MKLDIKDFLKAAGTTALSQLGPVGTIAGAVLNEAIDNDKSGVNGDKVTEETPAHVVLGMVNAMSVGEVAALVNKIKADPSAARQLDAETKASIKQLASALLYMCYTGEGKFKSIPAAIISFIVVSLMVWLGIY